MSRHKRLNNADQLRGFRKETEASVPSGLLEAARRSGQLNLSARGLTEVPQSVYRLNVDPPAEAKRDLSFGASDGWWEQTELTKLLLSSNQLQQLSDDIRLLPGLVTLDLHDNQLKGLPQALGELQELQQLRLSHNQLASLLVEVCHLKKLRSLTLHNNLLESVPDELGQLSGLTELDLSNNQLTSLPASVGCLTSLQKVNLSHNKLPCLPDCLGQLKNVKSLDCSNNQLKDIPPSISEMVGLEQLYLRHNRLHLLPQLPAPSLKELYVGNNVIERLEAEQLACLTAVSVLELRDNKIHGLPDQLSALSTLTRLDLTNNDVSRLPASVSLLPSLKVLLLEGNPLRGIRRDLLTKGTNELLKYLRGRIEEKPGGAVDGSTGLGLANPSEASINTHAIKTRKMLEYKDKQAVDIPDEVFDSVVDHEITSVDFSKNQLTALPTRLAELSPTLSDVNLGFNRLPSCSPDICSLSQLTHIDFRNNQLTDLPLEMNTLNKLRSIILNYNRFQRFPPVLYLLVSLETVLLGNNQLNQLDAPSLMKLVHLSTLDVSNNDLLHVPPELGLCTSLRSLSLQGNPFRTPRAATMTRGTDAVLEYLRSRIPS